MYTMIWLVENSLSFRVCEKLGGLLIKPGKILTWHSKYCQTFVSPIKYLLMPVHQNQCSTKCLKCLGQIGIREHPFEVNRWRAYLFSTISVPQFINRLLGTSEKGRGWLPIQLLYSCKKNICLLLYKSISPIAPPPPTPVQWCSGCSGCSGEIRHRREWESHSGACS